MLKQQKNHRDTETQRLHREESVSLYYLCVCGVSVVKKILGFTFQHYRLSFVPAANHLRLRISEAKAHPLNVAL